MDRFANNIKTLRKNRGLKQSDLLDKLGFTQARWSTYEKNLAEPSLADLMKIADFFNVTETELLRSDFTKEDKIESPSMVIIRKMNPALPNREKIKELEKTVNHLVKEVSGLKGKK